uniref:VWFA domain-containing protein n=1 Tax=Biomphalaria glabrata TaxID=6526 RepID=A0A2C9LAA7_BIOGL
MFLILVAALALVTPSLVEGSCEDDLVDCKKGPLDIAFVVDSSSSIWQMNFTKALWFVEDFVERFEIGPQNVRVSFVTYGDKVNEDLAFDFDTYTNKKALKNVISNTEYRGGSRTETGAAIAYMLDRQIPKARQGVRKVAIVLTDGNSQDEDRTKSEAARAVSSGLEVFAIGVGRDISEQELRNIASDSKHVFNVASYTSLPDIVVRLLFETCNIRSEPECQYDPVDISFVIDSSVSIGEDNFTLGLEFIKEFVDDFQINPSSARVAAVMFGDRVYSESAIPFDRYTNKKDLQDAISRLEWKHGDRTETGLGIDYMVKNFLPNVRPNIANLAIVITDGQSQSKPKTAAAAANAKSKGFTMIAVGVGYDGTTIDIGELQTIADRPDFVLIANDYSKLNLIKDKLIKTACLGIAISASAKQAPFYAQKNKPIN